MTTTRQSIVSTSNVSEKILSPDFSDPKFAIYEGNIVSGKSKVFQEVTTNVAGISSQVTNISKEGVGIGGYDKHFSIY